MDTQQKIAFLQDAAVICSTDDEPMRVNYVDEEGVHCTGEESGEDYHIEFEDVDFKNWIFYKLVKMEIPE